MAQALLAIRSGASPSQVMEALDPDASSYDGAGNAIAMQDDLITIHDQDEAPSGNQPFVQRDLSGSSHEIETGLSSHVISDIRSPLSQTMRQPSEVIAALESGVEAFFSCTGCIFHIYDQGEAQRLLSVVRSHIRDAGTDWPQLIFRDSALTQPKASLCSDCIMAAIGLQYTKGPILAMRFEPTEGNGMYRYISTFYECTKHVMEAVIENNVLEAMKICAALCVFNTIGHATVALAYAGTWSVLQKIPSL